MRHNRAVNTRFLIVLASWLAALALAWPVAAASVSTSVFLEELTSPELRDRVAAGTTTVLVPIGGTEQNGPHMVLGKHNVRVKLVAGQIAQSLGQCVVAPVMAYVPEGSVAPPAAHMRFAGTLSIPDAVFESVLDATARSLRQHGFRTIVFLGDHGGYQSSLTRVGQRLTRQWLGETTVLGLTSYYEEAQAPYAKWLESQGYSKAEIGTHAGLADTALALAVDPALVRKELLAEAGKAGAPAGVYGNPSRATADIGQPGIRRVVERAVQAIRDARK